MTAGLHCILIHKIHIFHNSNSNTKASVHNSLRRSSVALHCQVMPSKLQLISHSFWAESSSEAALEHLAGAQSLSTHEDREWPLHTVLGIKMVNLQLHSLQPFVSQQVVILSGIKSCITSRCLPEVPSALAIQLWLHSTVDGGLRSLHCCLGENPKDLHCHLDALVLVPPQVRLHHPRVQGEDAHPCACNTPSQTYRVLMSINML